MVRKVEMGATSVRAGVRRGVVCAMAVVLAVAAGAKAESAAEYNSQGVAHYNAQEWEEAVASFSKAYAADPKNTVVRRNLCNAYQAYANELAKAADFSGAAEQLESAIGIDPQNASPFVQLGAYYLRLNLVADATARLEEAIQLEPENVDARDLLGDAYYRSNDLPSALAQWEWVAETVPTRKGVAEKMAKAKREAGVEGGFRGTRSRHFNVTYAPKAESRDLTKVLTVLERAYQDLGRKLGNVFPPAPIQVIAYTPEKFTAATQLGEYVGALYDGKIRFPLKDANGDSLQDAELERRLLHEYVHVIVRHVASDNVPWWFNEGLAETLSRELSEADQSALQEAARKGALFSLRDLEETQLEKLDKDALRNAYLQAHATVQFLWSHFGANSAVAMLSALSEGTEPEAALRQCYRRSYDLLQKEVAQSFLRVAAK